LFHYNGHGVPRPTPNGEIWVFNKEFTQYIPLSLYEVQTWMGTPSIYVWDCSNAGLIVQSFLQFEEDRENEFLQRNEAALGATNPSSTAPNTPAAQRQHVSAGLQQIPSPSPINSNPNPAAMVNN
jgi:regulator-associated protein of mTOR